MKKLPLAILVSLYSLNQPQQALSQEILWRSYLEKARGLQTTPTQIKESEQYYASAIAELERDQNNKDTLSIVLLEAGLQLFLDNNSPKAEEYCNKAARLIPASSKNSAKLSLLQGMIKRSRGRTKEAEANFRVCLSDLSNQYPNHDHALALTNLARIYLSQKKLLEAQALYKEAFKESYSLYSATSRSDYLSLAQNLANDMVQNWPNEEFSLISLLTCYLQQPELSNQAEASFQSNSKRLTNSAEFHRLYARFFLKTKNNPPKALEELNIALKLQRSAPMLFEHSLINEELKNYKAAIGDLEDCLTLASDDTKYSIELARCKALDGNTSGALTELNHIIAKDSKNFAARLLRANVYNAQKQPGAALEDLDVIQKLDRPSTAFYRTRGIAYTLLDRRKEACDDFDKFLKEKPEDIQILIYYSGLLIKSDNFSQAKALTLKILDQVPNSKPALCQLGQCQASLGQSDEALKTARLLESINQTSPEEFIYAFTGQIYQKINRQEDAINSYKSVLKINPNNQFAKARLEELKPKPVEAIQKKKVTEDRPDLIKVKNVSTGWLLAGQNKYQPVVSIEIDYGSELSKRGLTTLLARFNSLELGTSQEQLILEDGRKVLTFVCPNVTEKSNTWPDVNCQIKCCDRTSSSIMIQTVLETKIAAKVFTRNK